jgi:uncharacterized protein (TIGR03067 family)
VTPSSTYGNARSDQFLRSKERFMKRILPGVVALLCLLTWRSQAAEPTDKDRLQQGTWVMTAVEFNGMKMDAPKGEELVLTFKGDKVTIKDKNKTIDGTFKMDEKKKELDITTPKDNDPKVTETVLGLYKLEGDTLKLVFKGADMRPKGIDDKEAFAMHFKKK